MPAPQPPKNQPSTPATAAAPKAKAKPEAAKIVRVRAKRLGFGPLSPNSPTHSRIRPNTVFNYALAPGAKMPSWVEEVDDENNPIGEHAAAAPAEEATASSAPSKDDVI